MKKYILLFTLLLSVISAYSQYGVGEWIGYNPYYKAELVEDTGDKVYFVSLGSLYSFDKDDNSIENYNKVGGLSDTEVSMIHYSTKTKQLVVIYKNSNIDLVKDNRLYNISDIYDKSLVGDKSIISYSENSGTLFLATSFGIVVVDLNKREISDSYNWGETVYAVGYNNGKLYASLRSGITVGNISDNLSDRSTWTTLTNSFYGVAMYSLNNKLHCLKSNGELVYLNEENNSWTRILSNSSLKRVKNWGDDSFAVIANDAKPFYIVDKDAKFQTITCPNNYTDISCNNNKGIFWSADANTDLTSFKLDGTTPVLQQSNIKSSGIGTTAPFHMAFCNNQLYVAGGGKALDRKGYRGVVSTFKDNAWYNVDADSTQAVTGQRFRDVVHVTPDPLDPDRVFAFTWGEGMYEFKNNKVVNLFNQTNSPILSIASSSLNYHRIDGGAFDKDHNLWFTASDM